MASRLLHTICAGFQPYHFSRAKRYIGEKTYFSLIRKRRFGLHPAPDEVWQFSWAPCVSSVDRLRLSPSCFVVPLRVTKTSAGFISSIGFRSQPIICHPANIRFHSPLDASPDKLGTSRFLRDSPDDNLSYLQSRVRTDFAEIEGARRRGRKTTGRSRSSRL